MNNEQMKDARLELEFVNPVYDIIDDAITYTMNKYLYKEYDLVKAQKVDNKSKLVFNTKESDWEIFER